MLVSVKKRVQALWTRDAATAQFRRWAAQRRPGKRAAKAVFVESLQPPSNNIAISLFATLFEDGQARIIPYHQTVVGPTHRALARIRHTSSGLSAFSSRKLLIVPARRRARYFAGLARTLQAQIETLRDLENLNYRGVLIGDLVYDVYLRRRSLPTVNLNDPVLRSVLAEQLAYVDAWFSHFRSESVAAVCVSHCVYQHAVPARVAIHLGVPAYQVTSESVYRLTQDFPKAYTDYVLYPSQFAALDEVEAERALVEAEVRMERRLAGEVGVDMAYSTASAYSAGGRNPGIRESDKLKVLVAVHDFFDSPHSYGNNFYPDFLVWMNRLGELSNATDYDWYIKTHPDIQGDGVAVLERFLATYPNFTVLPATASHHDLIQHGISVALTVFGTIASEYPYMGLTVVNASSNNPHVAYDFCITPPNVEEYEDIILNLEDHLLSPSKDEVLEYYYMRRMHNLQSWVYPSYDEYLRGVGGYAQSMSTAAYAYFLDSVGAADLERSESALRRFLESDALRLGREHFSGAGSETLHGISRDPWLE